MDDEKRHKRSLEDVSHFFLSSLDEKSAEPKAGEIKPRPFVLGVLDPETPCALPWLLNFAEKLDLLPQEALIFDFHPGEARARDRAVSSSARFEPVVMDPWGGFPSREVAREAKFVFLDIPWEIPGIRDALLPGLSGLIVLLKPVLVSLKAAYRLVKLSSVLFHGKYFTSWKDAYFPEQERVASSWTEIVRRFLGKEVEWFESPEFFVEKLEKQGRCSFDLEFLRQAYADPLSGLLFEKGRLSPEEIGAFSALTCREGMSAVLFPRD